jgi:hypothetical protein
MKLAIRAVVFHIVCIMLFAFVYFSFKFDFEHLSNKNKINFIDFLLLSTTIQAGVGISTINPITSTTKILIILQQILMISTHVFILYLFTL